MNTSAAMYLKSFRLPTMAAMVEETVKTAEDENWGYTRLLMYLCECEHQDRQQRKIARLLRQSGLSEDATFDAANLEFWPIEIRRRVPSLVDGDFVPRAENVLCFGLPGRGKTFFLEALGRELVLRHQYRVLCVRAATLVERLLNAKKELQLEKMLKRLDRYAVIIVDELGYTEHRRDEMEVFFMFLASRYQHRSVMISSNLVCDQWDRIFKDPMLSMAAADRLLHHGMVLRFTNPSIRDQLAKWRREKKSK
jgi:DNA replication protein DnaC